jgi:SAM-dependent methyltransferase
MINELNDTYWSSRYEHNQTGWDLHKASPPVKSYLDQWTDKQSRILIPGCGNAYEADYLLQIGFTHITLVDISHVLVAQLKQHFSGTPINILHQDFFEHNGTYDLILEQTFFCAIDPSLREDYAVKMKSLLATGGKLAGVLFNRHFEGGPPFGGNADEYRNLFSKYFSIKTLETCYNSILPRQNSESFFILEQLLENE